jgi:hypothetical protein
MQKRCILLSAGRAKLNFTVYILYYVLIIAFSSYLCYNLYVMLTGASSVPPETLAGMPAAWLDSSVVRHIDDPFSANALAEPFKSSIDLGEIDMEGCFGMHIAPLKVAGGEARLFPSLPEGQIAAHQMFIDAARLILGESRYEQATINFTYRDNPVAPGSRQLGIRPHVDGKKPTDAGQLRVVGVACSSLPTVRFQGAIRPDQLGTRGDLAAVRSLRKLTPDPVPLSHLVLLPPSLLHDSGRADREATEPTPRLFLRWHLTV